MPHPRTHAQRATRKVSPSSSTKKKHRLSARLASLDLQGQAHVNNDDGHRTSASATEDVRDVGPAYVSCSRAAARLLIRKLHATRWLCTTRNDRTLISWRSLRRLPFLFVLVSSGGIVTSGLLSTQQPTKWRRVNVVKPTVQHPDVGCYQELDRRFSTHCWDKRGPNETHVSHEKNRFDGISNPRKCRESRAKSKWLCSTNCDKIQTEKLGMVKRWSMHGRIPTQMHPHETSRKTSAKPRVAWSEVSRFGTTGNRVLCELLLSV